VEDFRRCATLLARTSLRSGDFGSILTATRRGDFAYLDPPYAVESRRIFRQYSKREFTKRDLERLGDHLVTLDKRGVSFLVSYADCREARDVLQKWRLRRIRVRRNIAGFSASRRMAVELLATNIDRES
jgi:DNA adenine methylase